MKITPIGAAGEVTGSCFLVETSEGRYLLDCGMFQGAGDDFQKNIDFPVDPETIDAVFLTHAHLDHCGRVPRLHFLGFRGPVFATPPTCDLLPFMWLDSAKVLEEDFERRVRKGRRMGLTTPQPLYREEDVLHLLPYLQPHPYEKELALGAVRVAFHQSGHILGSATVEIRDGYSSALFSGDLGTPRRNVVPDPAIPPRCDLVFCESTYGDRQHRGEAESIAELAEAINWAFAAGGNVLIPSFALERTQDLLFTLRGLRQRKEIPETMPVYVDSPLAVNLTRVFSKHIDHLDDATRAVFAAKDDPFWFPGLTMSTTVRQSQAINGQERAIIIAGSGMCHGGRILHHLRHNLWRANTAVVFVGFQARGTLGRRIVDRAPHVNIDHERIAVQARVFTLNGFSAHADSAALVEWLGHTGNARIVLNHGEGDASAALAGVLTAQGRTVQIAAPNAVYDTEEMGAAV